GRSINEHRTIHSDFLSGQRDSGTKKDKRTQNQRLPAVPHSVPHRIIRRSSRTTGKKKEGKAAPRPIHPLDQVSTRRPTTSALPARVRTGRPRPTARDPFRASAASG